jgi:hypothetical protein
MNLYQISIQRTAFKFQKTEEHFLVFYAMCVGGFFDCESPTPSIRDKDNSENKDAFLSLRLFQIQDNKEIAGKMTPYKVPITLIKYR